MITININIPTLTDFWVWSNSKAKQYDKDNWDEVIKFKNQILWHIAREPIPKENKDYLSNAVNEEFRKIKLRRCIWPFKN